MLSGSEYWAAAQVKAEETVQFVLRYSNQLAALSSKGFRVLFRGDAYNISSVDNVQYLSLIQIFYLDNFAPTWNEKCCFMVKQAYIRNVWR